MNFRNYLTVGLIAFTSLSLTGCEEDVNAQYTSALQTQHYNALNLKKQRTDMRKEKLNKIVNLSEMESDKDVVLRDGSIIKSSELALIQSNTLARIEAKRKLYVNYSSEEENFKLEGMIRNVQSYSIPVKYGSESSASIPITVLSVRGTDGQRYTLLYPNIVGVWPNAPAQFKGIRAGNGRISLAQIISRSTIAGNPSLDDARYYDQDKKTIDADALISSIKYQEELKDGK